MWGGAKTKIWDLEGGERKLGSQEPSPFQFTSPQPIGGGGWGPKPQPLNLLRENKWGPPWQPPFLGKMWGCPGEREIGVLGRGGVIGLGEKGHIWGAGGPEERGQVGARPLSNLFPLSGGGRGRQRGEKPRGGFGERGPRPTRLPPPAFPPTTGQLISQYKHSSRTGVTAPPAARLREAQPGRPGGEAGGAAGVTLSATRAGLGAGRPGAESHPRRGCREGAAGRAGREVHISDCSPGGGEAATLGEHQPPSEGGSTQRRLWPRSRWMHPLGAGSGGDQPVAPGGRVRGTPGRVRGASQLGLSSPPPGPRWHPSPSSPQAGIAPTPCAPEPGLQ